MQSSGSGVLQQCFACAQFPSLFQQLDQRARKREDEIGKYVVSAWDNVVLGDHVMEAITEAAIDVLRELKIRKRNGRERDALHPSARDDAVSWNRS